MIRKTFTLLLLTFLSACSSSTKTLPVTKTYVLDGEISLASAPLNVEGENVAIAAIKVADYLDRDGLITKQAGQQVTIARFNLWAESLPTLIHRSLKSELNKVSDTRTYVDHCGACSTIHLKVDHFYPTHDGRVILAGSYKVSDQTDTIPFLIEDRLVKDGYEESVAKMRKLIVHLASKISLGLSSKH